jgi:hypothetical protein
MFLCSYQSEERNHHITEAGKSFENATANSYLETKKTNQNCNSKYDYGEI